MNASKTNQEKLINVGIRNFQISLEGDEQMHNQYRITRENMSTFNLIYNNLLTFHKSTLEGDIMVRLHVNADNLGSMEALITKISEDFREDKRFTLFIRTLSRQGGKNDANLPVINDKVLSDEAVKRLQIKASSLGLKLNHNSFGDGYVCYAAIFNSLAIRSTREISKCTVALYDEKNMTGRLSEDGKITINKDKLEHWVRGQFSHNKMELNCPYMSSSLRNLSNTKRSRV